MTSRFCYYPTHRYSPKKRMGGFTLIEVSISALILAIALVGLIALQISTTRVNQGAFQRTQGVMLANFIIDAMRANRQAALAGDYDFGTGTQPKCNAPLGTSLADKDLTFWFSKVKETFPIEDKTCAFINCNGDSCTVRIQWEGTITTNDQAQAVELSTRL